MKNSAGLEVEEGFIHRGRRPRWIKQQQLAMVNYACGFNQSETGKYFE